MCLHFLIDGYNAINRLKSLNKIANLKKVRDSLINIIKQKLKSSNNKISVIFDGKVEFAFRSEKNNASIKIIFSKGESADDLIKKIVSQSDKPRQIAVVSDDKEIIYFTRSLKAKVVSVKDFFEGNNYTIKKEAGLTNQHSQKDELSYLEQELINKELRKKWG